MRKYLATLAAAGLLTFTSALRADENTTIVLYENNAGTVSASVQQIIPVGGTNQYQNSTSTYGNVSRVVMTRDIFMIYWQNSALTILPKQYVVNITINRQSNRDNRD